jgi:hypothetical protein
MRSRDAPRGGRTRRRGRRARAGARAYRRATRGGARGSRGRGARTPWYQRCLARRGSDRRSPKKPTGPRKKRLLPACLLQSRGTPWRAPVFYPERERVLPEMEPTGRVASESATATRGAGREHIPRRARFRVTTRGRGNPTTRHVGFRPRLAREELQAEFHGASARARRSRVAPRVAIARFPRAARISRLTRAANRARDRDAVRARSRRFPSGDSPSRQKSAARPNPRPRARFAAEVPARRRRERVALLGQPSRRKESRNHSSQDGSPRPPPRSPL